MRRRSGSGGCRGGLRLEEGVVFVGERVEFCDGVVAVGEEFLEVGVGGVELVDGIVIAGGEIVEFGDGVVAVVGEFLELIAGLLEGFIALRDGGGPFFEGVLEGGDIGLELVALGGQIGDGGLRGSELGLRIIEGGVGFGKAGAEIFEVGGQAFDGLGLPASWSAWLRRVCSRSSIWRLRRRLACHCAMHRRPRARMPRRLRSWRKRFMAW